MRVNTGLTVSVSANTERWLSELRAGRAFGGRAYQPNVAAQFARAQLLNPVGSGVTIIARLAVFGSSFAASVNVGHYNTALATLVATSRNLLSGGAAPVAEIRTETGVASVGSQLFAATVLANTSLQLNAEWLTELGAGEGLLFEESTVNLDLLVGILWMEA
jgi:hypothetical protein